VVEVPFLLDENIAAPLADKLDKAGHDVERVVDVSSEPSTRARGAVVTPIDMFGSRDADTHFHSVRGVSQTAKLA